MASEALRLGDLMHAMLNLPPTADLDTGWASVTVEDDANAPRINRGDVVSVNRGIQRFNGDGVYVVEIDGEPLIRYVQARGNGLHVYALNDAYAAVSGVPTESLCILGKCDRSAGLKAVNGA